MSDDHTEAFDNDDTAELDHTRQMPTTPQPVEPEVDLDKVDQSEALGFMAKRFAIWAVPLLAISILLVALGLPVWIIAIAMGIAFILLIFEIEL